MSKIEKILRPFAIKAATRLVLWGLTALLGVSAAQATDTATQLGSGLGAAVTLVVAVLIDRYHQKKDRAEIPPL